jgi:hypothetical protein
MPVLIFAVRKSAFELSKRYSKCFADGSGRDFRPVHIISTHPAFEGG